MATFFQHVTESPNPGGVSWIMTDMLEIFTMFYGHNTARMIQHSGAVVLKMRPNQKTINTIKTHFARSARSHIYNG